AGGIGLVTDAKPHDMGIACGKIKRQKFYPVRHVSQSASNETLGAGKREGGVFVTPLAGLGTDDRFGAFRREAHQRRNQGASVRAGEKPGTAVFNAADEAVGGSQVDADN